MDSTGQWQLHWQTYYVCFLLTVRPQKTKPTLRFEGQICSRQTRKMLHTYKGSTFCRNVGTTCMQIQECPWALNYRKQSLDTTQRSKTNQNSVTGASYCDSQSNNSTDCSSPSMPLRPLPDDLDCKCHSAESSSFHSLSYDRSTASSKASCPQIAIQCFLFQSQILSRFLKTAFPIIFWTRHTF
jgi:hypothetical protein